MLSTRNRSRFLTVLALLLLWTAVPSPALGEPTAATETGQRVEHAEPPQEGVELLSAEELEQLQAQDEEPGEEVVGGALSNQELTYIVIALAAAVLVLVLS